MNTQKATETKATEKATETKATEKATETEAIPADKLVSELNTLQATPLNKLLIPAPLAVSMRNGVLRSIVLGAVKAARKSS
jgi:hypothetical protein